MNKRFLMAYSMGKDSTLALQKMINMGYEPAVLLIGFNYGAQHSIMHNIPIDSLHHFADSLNIPVELVSLHENNDWASVMSAGTRLKKKYDTDLYVTGDIDHQKHIDRNKKFAELTGLTLFMPLSGMTREECLKEEIENGYNCIITTIMDRRLPISLLGQKLTYETIEIIKNCGCDACGEDGEYHTLVVDSPLHRYPIPYRPMDIAKGLMNRQIFTIE